MKKNILLVAITAIICIGGTTFAYTYNASDIGYKNGNLEDAIDELYTKATTYKNLDTPTTATSNKILNTYTAYDNNGSLITGNIGTYAGSTEITPDSSQHILSTQGKYLSGDITIDAIPSSYKNLTTLTDAATSSDIVSGKKAYDSDGNVITGSVNTDCIFGSKTITSSFTTSTGQELFSFAPSKIYAVVYNNNSVFVTINADFNNDVTYMFRSESLTTNNSSQFIPTTTSLLFRTDSNNHLYAINFSQSFVGNTFDYMACK